MKINKGDIILICILVATFVFFAINEFNILIGVSQFDSSFASLFGIIFGGELLSFAIYKIGMAKYQTQDDKGTIEQIENDIKEETQGKDNDEDEQIY